MWGFQHYPGVVPDIVTSAKGLSSSISPISMVAISDKMLEFFEENSMGWGSTFQAHPVSMAAAYANIKDMLKTDLLGHVQGVSSLFDELLADCASQHPSVKQYRSKGLFGALDMTTPTGEAPHLFHESQNEATKAYFTAFKDNGLMGLFRPPIIHIAPPLVITKEELKDGFERQHRALDVLDKALGF